MWGVVLISCFLAGGVATGIALRLHSRRPALTHAELLRTGEIVWGGQVRWRRGRTWGHSGSLVLSPDRTLTWTPSASSLERGATPAQWRAGEYGIDLLATRRDITGISLTEYRMHGTGAPSSQFGMFHEVGSAPCGEQR